MESKRQSTVKPVFGSLTQFFGMRKVNIKGIKQANKDVNLSDLIIVFRNALYYY
jgi:hypothetical protein